MQKKLIALAVSGTAAIHGLLQHRSTLTMLGSEGPADFLRPKPFGHNEKPWGKRNRRKLGGMKGGAA